MDHQILRQRLIVLNDPESIRQVCGAHASRYRLTNLHRRMLTPSLGEGLIVAEGERWRRQRRASTRAAHPRSFLGNHERATRRVDELLDAWSARSETRSRDLLDDLCVMSIDLIAHSFFGLEERIAGQAVIDLITRHRAAVERVDWLDVMGLPPRLRSAKMLSAQRIAHELDDEIWAGVDRWRVRRDDTLSDRDFNLRDFAVSILAGFESVAVTCNWMLALLADRPALVAAIRAEALDDDVEAWSLKTDARRSIALCVLLETLRLFPPLPLIYRQAVDDDVVHAGAVRRNAVLCMSPWLVHRNAALWTDAELFRPERWRQDPIPQAFMPFGVGARQCVGMRMAIGLCLTFVKRALDRFDFHLAPECRLVPRAGVSLRPLAPLRFHLTRAPE